MSSSSLETVKRKPLVTITSYLGILCGFYFKFGSKIVSILIGSYCVFLCASLSALVLRMSSDFFELSTIFEYILRSLLLFCGLGRKYINYFSYLENFDSSVGFKLTYRHFLCSIIFLIFIPIGGIISMCLIPLGNSSIMFCTAQCLFKLNEFNQVYGMIVLESFWRRVQFLRKAMESDIRSNAERESNRSIIEKYLRFYILLLNHLETVSMLFSIQVIAVSTFGL